MSGTVRSASPLDLVRIARDRRRQRVLRLNPPHDLVHPEPLLPDLVRAQTSLKRQPSYLYVYAERPGIAGYLQASCPSSKSDEWVVTTLATRDGAPASVAEALVARVCREAGEAGVLRVYVKMPREDPHLVAFRASGFTHYTTERIWGNLVISGQAGQVEEPPHVGLRSMRGSDAWQVMQLYSTVTPPAVQRAEMANSRDWERSRVPRFLKKTRSTRERQYVWSDEKGGLGGYAHLVSGPRGHWISAMFLPDRDNRERCRSALRYLLWKATRSGYRPVYLGLREYQTELEGTAADLGFHMLVEQDLMVKYLALSIREKQPMLVPFLVPKQGELSAATTDMAIAEQTR